MLGQRLISFFLLMFFLCAPPCFAQNLENEKSIKENLIKRERAASKFSVWPYTKPASKHEATGTLIVSYHTGHYTQRMERIRFLLTDTLGNSTMFPQKELFEKDSETGGVRVTILNLPPGQYSLQFLVPNTDNLFPSIPIREFIIRESEVLRLHQTIEPQFGTIEASVDPESFGKALSELPFDVPISIVEESTNRPLRESLTGHLRVDDLPPGEYLVVFGDIGDYIPPEPIKVNLKPKSYEGEFIRKYMRKTSEFSVFSNREDLSWVLLKEGKEVLSERGNIKIPDFPTGKNFRIQAEQIQGYTADVSPAETFDVDFNSPAKISIIYTPEYGYLSLDAPALKEGETLTIALKSLDGGPILNIPVHQEGDKLVWKSGGILTGRYLVEYSLPESYEPLAPQEITIIKGQQVLLSPDFTERKNLYIRTGHPHAIFTLTHIDSGKTWEGRGYTHTFRSLTPGTYHVKFKTTAESLFVPPPDQTLTINPDQDMTLEVSYRQAGQLIISSNITDYSVHIRALDHEDEIYNINVPRSSKTLSMPEGRYILEFNAIGGKRGIRYGDNRPDPIKFKIFPDQQERIHGIYEPQKGSLVVTSNIDQAIYTVFDISGEDRLVVGRFSGKHSVIPLTFVGQYLIEFGKVANYQIPEKLNVTVHPDERQVVGGVYLPLHELVTIPKGPAIVGDLFGEGGEDERPARTVEIDTFSISVHEVTNEQYSMWLTKALRDKKILYGQEHGIFGTVKDLEGNLLFETVEADPDSQIQVVEAEGGLVFKALPGKELHPVVEVTWYGANAYCKDNGYRLPTEAEWEKAASMAVTRPEEPLKKYRFGCGRDIINVRLSNYLDRFESTQRMEVKTKKVGFFDGINMLETSSLIAGDLEADPSLIDSQYGTLIARSPYGLYDMSGNVREWTSDWYDPDLHKTMPDINPRGPGHGTKKVTKGGSYNSFVYELRSSARIGLSPNSSDAYTGFRVVLDQGKE